MDRNKSPNGSESNGPSKDPHQSKREKRETVSVEFQFFERLGKLPSTMGDPPILSLLVSLLSLVPISLAYRPGDIVPMSKMGQYHSVCSPILVFLPRMLVCILSFPITCSSRSQLYILFISVQNSLARYDRSTLSNFWRQSRGIYSSIELYVLSIFRLCFFIFCYDLSN